jgi:hypothetical protein
MMAKCPNSNCDGFDSCYFVDDLIHYECDKCGTTWDSYDVENNIENCFNIKLKKDI